MLGWFCKTCRNNQRPDINDLLEGLDDGKPSLKLKKKFEAGPFKGKFAGQNRELQIRFSYNRKFKFDPKAGRSDSGSWTRNMHPDYTLTFWPAEFEEKEAEREELLVHVHFDAKYRVENLAGLFGSTEEDDADTADSSGNYKRQDLLKMHAYRDAIKRSHGAYVLYPGTPDGGQRMQGFHEILPGLGAFPVSPDNDGSARGTDALHNFLEEILNHLSNRTTAMERATYHLARSNETDDSGILKEEAVQYGNSPLPEKDHFHPERPALPPSEHRVLVVWSDNDQELDAWLDKGIAYVRLGTRHGSLPITEDLFGVRHLLIRRSGKVLTSLKKLTNEGFKIWSGDNINNKFPKFRKKPKNIYAVFGYVEDQSFKHITWDEEKIWEKIQKKPPMKAKHLLIGAQLTR